MPFYTFIQNNSGGSFVTDEDVSIVVVIEADSANDANKKAEDIGIYFNGCALGYDCDCCGDRWSEIWSDRDGTTLPALYGKSLSEDNFSKRWVKTGEAWGYIYRKDGKESLIRDK